MTRTKKLCAEAVGKIINRHDRDHVGYLYKWNNGELQKAERLIEFVKRLVREPTIIDRICATVGHAFESIRIIVLKTSCEILTSVCTTIPQTTELLIVLQKYIKRHFSRRHPFN